MALAKAQATLAAQQGITAELRAFLSAPKHQGVPGETDTHAQERPGG